MFIQHLFRDSFSIRLLVTSPRHDGSSPICSANVQFHSPRNYCVCAKFAAVLMVRHLMHAIECASNEPDGVTLLLLLLLIFPCSSFLPFSLRNFFLSFHLVSGVWFAFVTLCPPPSVCYRCVFHVFPRFAIAIQINKWKMVIWKKRKWIISYKCSGNDSPNTETDYTSSCSHTHPHSCCAAARVSSGSKLHSFIK